MHRGMDQAPMQRSRPASDPTWRVTWEGCRVGMAAAAPFIPSTLTFGVVFGAAASTAGLSLVQAVAMSGIVFAGMSQMVALQLWTEIWTWSLVGTVAIVTLAINGRMLLMGASLHPWLRNAPWPLNAVNLFFLTDQAWVIGLRHYESGGRDYGVLIGYALITWPLWTLATIPGFLAGNAIGDPRRFGLDLVLPIVFAIMLIPLWRGRRAALPWVMAAIVAVVVERLGGGYLYIAAGAVAGGLVAALLPEPADA